MDKATARDTLNDQLSALADRRDRAQEDLDRAILEIGATTTYLRDMLGQPKARSAKFARLSPSHMTELMRTAAEKSVTIPDPLKRVPFLRGVKLQSYIKDRGGPQRIVASVYPPNTMWMSNLDPESFLNERYSGGLRFPTMLIRPRDGGWVAVDNVTVGYYGTGPGNAQRELRGLGISPDVAQDIAHSSVSNLNLDTGEGDVDNSQPYVDLGALETRNEFFVVKLAVEDPEERDRRLTALGQAPRDLEDTHSGFDPTGSPKPPLDQWLAALEQRPCPQWMFGTTRARVYLDRQAAEEDGFTEGDGFTPHQTYQVIIEQGRLQLWLDIPTSNDPTVLFTPEIYTALDKTGFYTADLRARDEQSSFWRWLRSLGAHRPKFVDLDDHPLRYSPLKK